MTKIKDELFLGFIAGIAGNLITNIFNNILYLLKITNYTRWHLAASLFFPKTPGKTLSTLIIGITTDYTVAIFMGILLTYILMNTGFDFSLIKGISLGLLFWLIGIGIVVSNFLSISKPIDASTQVILLMDHIVLGALIAWFIGRYSAKIHNNHS